MTFRPPFFGNPYFKHNSFYKSPLKNSNCNKYSSNQAEPNNCNSNNDNMKNNTFSDNNDFFEIFGIKLYYDDILLISLIFFLYNEDVDDTELFIALILLLLS